jgi:hypothetical protein
MMYNCCFPRQNFEKKIEIIGDVVNSNNFTRIFGHSTGHLDLKDLHELKEFEGLELMKFKELKDLELLNLIFLNIQRRSK